MGKLRNILLAASGAVAIFLFSAVIVQAASSHADVRLNQNETYNGPYIRAGENITVSGTVNGDVILAGSNITIDGTVNGNVYAVGQTITLRGLVAGNAHLAAMTVQIDGKGNGSIYAAGYTVKTSKDSDINGAGFMAGNTIALDGKLGSQLYAAGSSITLNNTVNGNTTLAGNLITVTPSASINGNLKYYSKNDANIQNDGTITGSISKQVPPQKSRSQAFFGRISGALFSVFAWFVIGLILLGVLPRQVVEVADQLAKRFWPSLGIGLLFVLVTPLILILLLVTIIGIPAVIAAALVFAAILIVARVFAALWLGRLVLSVKEDTMRKNVAALFLGLLMIALVGMLPFVGPLVQLVALLAGAGVLVLTSKDTLVRLRKPTKAR